jgi:tRNA threonylcarbamoyladenosine biosynthesis protein TsaE
MKTISLKDLSKLPLAAKTILEFSEAKKIFCFYGDLGAGKTTLIKEMCRQLGAKDSGSSPTFSLVNEYSTNSGFKIFHFDFYRIKNETEAYDIGFEEYLNTTDYCFIEWPEKIERLLPPEYIKVKIDVKEGERIISIS